MYHWTDSKIRVHAFYCLLGISLLKYVHQQAQAAWPGLSMEQLLQELRQIQQFVLLYPPQGEKGPPRAAIVRSKQSFPQQQLAKTLGLEDLEKQKKYVRQPTTPKSPVLLHLLVGALDSK